MLPPAIDAVRNRKTGKLFILVDDSLGTHFRVVNPTGEILTLPDLLFDDEQTVIAEGDAPGAFTEEQLKAFSNYLDAEANAPRPKPAPVSASGSHGDSPQRKRLASTPSRRSASSTSKSSRAPGPRGVVVTWSSPRLAFYRHKIEPLGSHQSFRVQVDGVGPFEIPKEEFLAVFNDVVMSPSYRREGFFSYPEIPDKARRFLKA